VPAPHFSGAATLAAAPRLPFPHPPTVPVAPAPSLSIGTTATTSAADLATVKNAFELLRAGKWADADQVRKTISDPLARKLVEWLILRNDDNDADFARYARFISESPDWPNIGALRRRAEAQLWQERGACLFCSREAEDRQGTVCSRAGTHGSRRPQPGSARRARSVAARILLGGFRKTDSRDFCRSDHDGG
jgi:hypothetical protein